MLKFIDTSSDAYLSLGIEAIQNIKGKIPMFEINTGAIARGYRTSPYPQKEFLTQLKNCGFGAVITSDCHDCRFIDCYYKEAREMLLNVGFNSQWILSDNGFKEVEL
jgi:histidinol-phosphatase (PHP family)